MSLNDKSTLESPAPPRPAGSLSARAMAGVVRPSATAINPPSGNTGGSFRQSPELKGKSGISLNGSATKCPPPPRKSRGKVTTPKMEAFSRLWFFDWLTLTIPNGLTGTGEKRRSTPAQRAEAMRLEGPARSEAISRLDGEDRHGVREETDAVENLCLFAVVQGLRPQRIGRGSDGYNGGLSYGENPTDGDRLLSVRAGHKTNMPGIEISGGDGACERLAPHALNLMGPVLLARADVSYDHSQEGLYDSLLDYCRRVSRATKMAAPRTIESETGKTFYFGKGEASVKVYHKDLERVARGKINPDDADPHLIRVEFTFAPKSNDKAGMARLASNGAGHLLGVTHWVRNMVEEVGRLTGVTEKGDAMGVARKEKRPDPRTASDRSNHGLEQYAKTHCSAVVTEIVRERFGGDWLKAEITAEEVREAVLDRVARHLDASQAPASVVSNLGVDGVRSVNEEASRNAVSLRDWMDRQHKEREESRLMLENALRFVQSSGDGEESSEGSAVGWS